MSDKKSWYDELLLMDTKHPELTYKNVFLNRKERRKLNSIKTTKRAMRNDNIRIK